MMRTEVLTVRRRQYLGLTNKIMIRFKESELEKTSDEYWLLDSIKTNTLTYSNPVMYQGYRIFHWDEVDPACNQFRFVHEDYDGADDAKDHRFGYGDSINDCIRQINEYILDNEVED